MNIEIICQLDHTFAFLLSVFQKRPSELHPVKVGKTEFIEHPYLSGRKIRRMEFNILIHLAHFIQFRIASKVRLHNTVAPSRFI